MCKYLTIYTPRKRVKWFIAVILNNSTKLILKARQEGYASVQYRFGFSTINYCRRTKQGHINILPEKQEMYWIVVICLNLSQNNLGSKQTYFGILAEGGATVRRLDTWLRKSWSLDHPEKQSELTECNVLDKCVSNSSKSEVMDVRWEPASPIHPPCTEEPQRVYWPAASLSVWEQQLRLHVPTEQSEVSRVHHWDLSHLHPWHYHKTLHKQGLVLCLFCISSVPCTLCVVWMFASLPLNVASFTRFLFSTRGPGGAQFCSSIYCTVLYCTV